MHRDKGIKKVVVIGCSGAGAMAAKMLKKLNSSVEVTIIRPQEEKGLLTRCATPYIAGGYVTVDSSYKDDTIFLKEGIKIVNIKAVSIDRKTKKVITEDGLSYKYDKLVLATGAKPIVFPIPGIDLAGVFTLRTSGDAVSILTWINSRRVKTVVVIGAGAIGIEIAYLIALHGVRVILVEMLGQVLGKVIDSDMSKEVERYIRNKGIELRLNQRVDSIIGEEEVEAVELSSKERLPAKMVIISGGIQPNIELAKKAGVRVSQFGIKVNEYLQTSDPDIFAAGDVIEYRSFVTDKPTWGQLRPNAVIGGRVAAKNILGYRIKFPKFINAFATKFFDISIAGAGITEEEARKEGIETISTKQSSFSKHSMMRDRKPYIIKLIFNKRTKRIIGGQLISESDCPIKHIDLIALAIRNKLTVLDLTTIRCAGQPELSPDPGMEPIALASEAIFKELYRSSKDVQKRSLKVVRRKAKE